MRATPPPNDVGTTPTETLFAFVIICRGLKRHPSDPQPPPFSACSPNRSVSPAGGWTIVNRPGASPCSSPAVGSGHGSSRGGKRRFFGLSESAEAEAEAASNLARRGEGGGWGGAETGGGGGGARVRGGGGGGGVECIDAHRMVVSLRSDPMRAMLRSGELAQHMKSPVLKDAVRAVVL